MNVFFTTRRRRLSQLLALAALVPVLLGLGSAQGTGRAAVTEQAAGVSASASAKPKPLGIDAFTVVTIKDVVSYWASTFSAEGRPWKTLRYLTIKKDRIVNGGSCGLLGDEDVNPRAAPAAYCSSYDTVVFSTRWLYNHASNNATTPYGVKEVVAHEVAHAVQARLGLRPGPRVEHYELQADCLSAVWVRHKFETGAATGKDATDARRAIQTAGDYNDASPGHHGTADERVAAWMWGYRYGSYKACLR